MLTIFVPLNQIKPSIMCALVLNPLMSADARGSVSSNVFSRNKTGAIVRNRTKPTNVSTPARDQVKTLFASVTQFWRTISEAQRDAWNAAAPDFPYLNKLGQPSTYSGQQLFMKFNQQLVAIGSSIVSSAPVSKALSVIGFSAVNTCTTISIILDCATNPVPADETYVIEATAPISAGIFSPSRSAYKQIKVVAAAADPTADLITEYTAVFGAPLVGQKIFFRMFVVAASSGQYSTYESQSKVVS
jgi:hypothetical protein